MSDTKKIQKTNAGLNKKKNLKFDNYFLHFNPFSSHFHTKVVLGVCVGVWGVGGLQFCLSLLSLSLSSYTVF